MLRERPRSLRDTRPIQSGPRLLRPVLEAAAPRARHRAVSLSHRQSSSISTCPTPAFSAPTPSLPTNASTSAPAPGLAPSRGISYAPGSPENLLLPPQGLGPSSGTARAFSLPTAPACGRVALPCLLSSWHHRLHSSLLRVRRCHLPPTPRLLPLPSSKLPVMKYSITSTTAKSDTNEVARLLCQGAK